MFGLLNRRIELWPFFFTELTQDVADHRSVLGVVNTELNPVELLGAQGIDDTLQAIVTT